MSEILERFKQKFNEEKTKLSAMNSLGDKLDYIWTYYNIHIIAVVIAVLIIGSILNTTIFNPPADTYVSINFYGSYLNTEIAEEIASDLSEKLNLVTDDYDVTIDNYYEVEDDYEMSMALTQRFAALVAAQELDIIIAPQEYFEALASQEYFYLLDELFSGEEIAEFGDRVAYGRLAETDFDTGEVTFTSDYMPYGIRIESGYFEQYGLNIDDWVLGFVVNSQRVEAAQETADYILGFR